MVTLADDTEEAPWMTMGDLQFWSASSFAHSLRNYARRRQLGWYVASMLPIDYRWKNLSVKKRVSPDGFVAFVPEHARQSFDAEEEGGFPPFVVEVVSPSSIYRDEEEKRQVYDLMGVKEYALFTPRDPAGATLRGYRRDAAGQFVDWPTDAQGRLWSTTLELYLVARGALLQAQTADGEWLMTPEQSEVALQAAEAEAERLRRELDALRAAANQATE
jgi:Uma2 family endonuclease